MRRLLPLLLVLLLPVIATAAIEVNRFEDPAKEAIFKQLIEELRCLVCQNQNLAASNAELAQDMRRKTYQMVQAGSSHTEVVDFMVKRYGDFVLYRPPFNLSTFLLWVGPFIILGGGILLLIILIKGRNKSAAIELNDSDLKRARNLLGEEDNNL